jgi:hypothetical protein
MAFMATSCTPPQDAFTSMSWVNLTANAAGKLAGFVDWGWAVGGCTKAAAAAAAAGSPPPPSCASLGLPDEALFATAYEKQGDWDTAWDPDVHFVRSDTWFKSIEQKARARVLRVSLVHAHAHGWCVPHRSPNLSAHARPHRPLQHLPPPARCVRCTCRCRVATSLSCWAARSTWP